MVESTFLGRHLEIVGLVNRSVRTEEQRREYMRNIRDVRRKAEEAYAVLAARLPDGHAWKHGKPRHATAVAGEVIERAETLGLPAEEAALVELMVYAHDIGRLVEAGRVVSGQGMPAWHHGRDSADVLRAVSGYLPGEHEWFDAMLIAIERHADQITPSRETLGGHAASWPLTTLLRDLDKRAGFRKARAYTEDDAEKARQAEANWPRERRSDPSWGMQMGRVDPPELLLSFLGRETLPRHRCRSYEAYMLQYLAWIFDVQHDEILAWIVEEDGPRIVLAYLRRQLPGEEYAKIAHVTEAYLETRTRR